MYPIYSWLGCPSSGVFRVKGMGFMIHVDRGWNQLGVWSDMFDILRYHITFPKHNNPATRTRLRPDKPPQSGIQLSCFREATLLVVHGGVSRKIGSPQKKKTKLVNFPWFPLFNGHILATYRPCLDKSIYDIHPKSPSCPELYLPLPPLPDQSFFGPGPHQMSFFP